jgi:chromosomal replication initiation ATPase DnaA
VNAWIIPGLEETKKDYLLRIICNHYKTSIEAINSSSRKSEIILAKQATLYYLNKYLKYHEKELAKEFHLNRATVLYHFRRYQGVLDLNQFKAKELDEKIKNICKL